jgi:hypothetical protein
MTESPTLAVVPPVTGLKTLALIDGEIAESRLDHRGPRRARREYGTTD